MVESASRGSVFLALLALLLLPTPLSGAYLTWRTEIVNPADTIVEFPSLAVDSSGQPHITYYDKISGVVKHAQKVGATWERETVDGAGVSAGGSYVGSGTSIALDSSGNLHVSYQWNNTLRHAWRHNVWTKEPVGSATNAGQFISLAVDASNEPHIGYYDTVNAVLKYAWRSAGVWSVETVDSAGDVGKYVSITLDSTGDPHMSYLDASQGDLKHAWKRGGIWVKDVVDSDGYVGEYASIAVDSLDNVHISYRDESSGHLKYAWRGGTTWTVSVVDSSGSVGFYTSIAVDPSGSPSISYRAGFPDNDLKYAWFGFEGWTIETVDSAGVVGGYTSLALDQLDNPHIAYYDFTNTCVKYAMGLPTSTPTPSPTRTPMQTTTSIGDSGGSPLSASVLTLLIVIPYIVVIVLFVMFRKGKRLSLPRRLRRARKKV